MSNKQRDNSKYILLLLIFLFIGGLHPLFSQDTSLELALEKFENQEYTEAEEDLKAILEVDSENFEARKLLIQIGQIRKKEKAAALTEIALLEIDNLNFEKAIEVLKEAIILDTSNKQAKELYLALIEVYEIEQKSTKEIAQMAQVEIPEEKTSELEPESVEKQVEDNKKIIGLGELIEGEEETGKLPDRLSIKIMPNLTFAGSNALDFINSDISLLGLYLDSRFYFLFQRRFGVSLDYSGSFIKTSGDDNIKFMVHRVNVSTRFRMFLFETAGSKLTAGARISYHLFGLQNQLDEGAYNFNTLYGPSIGVFLSDPVIYRFLKKDFFKNLGFEVQTDFLFIPGQDEESAITALEFYLGAYYKLGQFNFGVGYRQYRIMQQPISESYHDIGLGVRYSYN